MSMYTPARQESFLPRRTDGQHVERRWRRWASPAAVVVLAAFVLGSMGWVPSPEALTRLFGVVASSERYPCQGCGCGCASERECWTQCCCHTLSERVAWARRSGVPVPSYVDLSGLALAGSQDADAVPACGLCPSGLAEAQTTSSPACEIPPISSMSALACKGLSTVLGLAVLPGVWSGGLSIDLQPVPDASRRCARSIAAPVSRSLDVPSPPPRAA